MKGLFTLFLMLCLLSPPAAQGEEGSYYLCQAGDTIPSIAALYGVEENKLKQQNFLPAAEPLPGQILFLPSAGGSGAYATLFLSPNATVPAYTAAHFQVDTGLLESLNFFPEPGRVLRGQVLKIPRRTCDSPLDDPALVLRDTLLVQRGDTLRSLARQLGIEEEALASYNGLSPDDSLRPGFLLHLTPPLCPYRAYCVQKGDTLSRIARRFSMTTDDLLAVNDLPNPHVLVQGQVLLLKALPQWSHKESASADSEAN